MGLFSWIGKIFRKIFRAILRFLKKFWWVIVIALIVMAVFFPLALPAIGTWLSSIPGTLLTMAKGAAGWIVSLFEGLTLGESLALGAGLAFLVAPEETAAALGSLAESVGSAAGSIVGGAAKGLFSSPFGTMLAVGASIGLVVWLMSDDEEEDNGSTQVVS